MIAHRQSCKMKKLSLILFLFFALGCSFPVQLTLGTPTATATLTPTPAATQAPPTTAEPGTEKNPLILALGPSPHPSADAIAAVDQIAAYITSRTGYKVVTISPPSESALIEAFAKGNAHIAPLSPYGFVLAHESNSVTALMAQVRDGKMFYGAQFIVNRDKEFTVYFNETSGENTADADVALKQFQDKKPCWTDDVSPSGFVVPFGLLKQAQVEVRSGAFLGNQPSVVRAVYSADICDFGATFIDARTSPTLEADYPDVLDKVRVAWRIPEIIPYNNISVATSLPIEMRRNIERAISDFMTTPDGKTALQTAYGFDELKHVEDTAYDEFIKYVVASGLDLTSLIK